MAQTSVGDSLEEGDKMAELTQLIRWNTGFIRGLAQSVLNRAKSIRHSLPGYGSEAEVVAQKANPIQVKKATRKPTPKGAATSKYKGRVAVAKRRTSTGKALGKTKKANV
jgi:hypothetical protein